MPLGELDPAWVGDILRLFNSVRDRPRGSGWVCDCPLCCKKVGERRLSIAPKTKGGDGLMLKCHRRGCSPDAIMAAVGRTVRDLFAPGSRRSEARATGTNRPALTATPAKAQDAERRRLSGESLLHSLWCESVAEMQAGTAAELAHNLGVSVASINWLHMVYDGCRSMPTGSDNGTVGAWSFPEWDGSGELSSLFYRFGGGVKWRLPGAAAGLIYSKHPDALALLSPDPLVPGPRPVLIVEGQSDTAAALSLGVYAIGRPSNMAGAADLADWLSARRAGLEAGALEVIVLGERDDKPDGSRPGYDGAREVSYRLAQLPIDHRVRWALPPAGFKDVREWLNDQPADPNDPAAMREAGRRFLAELCWCDRPATTDGPASEREPSDQPHDAGDRVPVPREAPCIEEWLPPPIAKCPRAVGSMQAKRGERTRLAHRTLGCKTWGCPVCDKRQKIGWARHLFDVLVNFDGPVHVSRVTAGSAEAVRKAGQRAKDGGRRVMIQPQPAGPAILLSAAETPGSWPVTTHDAMCFVRHWLNRIDPAASPKYHRPVVPGRAWSRPKPTQGEHAWICKADRSPEVVRRAAAAAGLKVLDTIDRDTGDAFNGLANHTTIIAAGYTDAEAEGVAREIGQGRVPSPPAARAADASGAGAMPDERTGDPDEPAGEIPPGADTGFPFGANL